MNENKFIQGYVCAIAAIAAVIGEHTNVKEALYCGIGSHTEKDLLNFGVEQHDIDILKANDYL